MKKPKDKAAELVDKMFANSLYTEYTDCIECAKIAVDDIINALGTKCSECQSEQDIISEYWQQVRLELEKL